MVMVREKVFLNLYLQGSGGLLSLIVNGHHRYDMKPLVLRSRCPGDPHDHIGRGQLGGHFPSAKSRSEMDQARAYLKHCREECGLRLCEAVYNADGTPNRYWMAFSKRRFMGIPVS